MKAKFIKGLNASKPIMLTLLVSMGNEKEEGEYLEEFINLVNRHKTRIEKVEFILGCDLHRHYIGDEKATEQGTRWIDRAKPYLSKLEIKYEAPKRWRTVTGTTAFKEMKQRVDEWYKSDPAFAKIVDGIANQHAHKAGREAAIAYLLEESAGIATLGGYTTYPHPAFNGAIAYVLEKTSSTLQYCGYRFDQQPNPKNNRAVKEEKEEVAPKGDESELDVIFESSLHLSKLMRRSGVFNIKQQLNLFEEAIRLNQQYKGFVKSTLIHKPETTLQKTEQKVEPNIPSCVFS